MRTPKMWFPNRFDTNRAVQVQVILDLESRGIVHNIRVAKTKALIGFAVTAKLLRS